MKTEDLIKQVRETLSGQSVQVRPFGRGETPSLWVEARFLSKALARLKEDPAIALDWLGNLSGMELEGALILSYFLESCQKPGHELVLRISVVPKSPDSVVEAPSVRAVHPAAAPFEREIGDLFGVSFRGTESDEASPAPRREGFPLRKSNEVSPS